MHFDIASPSNLAMKVFSMTNSVELRKSLLFLRYFINYDQSTPPKIGKYKIICLFSSHLLDIDNMFSILSISRH